MDKKNTILHSDDLTIGYHSKKQDLVLAKDLNLSLSQGELVCLMGKNGIGKSTLLRTITKVQEQLSGEVFIENDSLNSLNYNELARKISLVLTERIPSSNLTVYELIALGRQPYTNWIGTLTDKDKEQINFAIEQLGIEDLLSKKCDELSDGQLQRVMICRALSQNTDIIILDEPTAHLDIQHKIETFKILKNLAHNLNKSILISTHEIQLGLQTADKLWLMTRSGILEGSPEEMIKKDQINKLFDSKLVHFDKNSLQFSISE
ncbi:MAG: ABC transporter ATP-binding protein [Bacteroidota bacterium]